MKVQLKPLEDQVIVITGASSGIGLATVKMAARRGARVVLAARNEEALRRAVDEIQEAGGRAAYAVADVAQEEQVRRVAETAGRAFGGFDTWVNDAGVSIYGRFDQVSLEDQRRLFDTNFWGVVHGTRVAAKHLRTRGGAIINIGSIVSDRAIPLQGAYSASKHAVKGYTDAVRMELEKEGAPIAVTLIKPSAINTPYIDHAKNYMDEEPNFPPPVYAPEVVARAILRAAEHPMRDVTVGGGGRLIAALGQATPRGSDRAMEATLFDAQKKRRPDTRGGRSALYEPGDGGRERGSYEGHTMESSLYTQAAEHPLLTAGVAVGVGLLLAASAGYWGYARAGNGGYGGGMSYETQESRADRLHYAGRY